MLITPFKTGRGEKELLNEWFAHCDSTGNYPHVNEFYRATAYTQCVDKRLSFSTTRLLVLFRDQIHQVFGLLILQAIRRQHLRFYSIVPCNCLLTTMPWICSSFKGEKGLGLFASLLDISHLRIYHSNSLIYKIIVYSL